MTRTSTAPTAAPSDLWHRIHVATGPDAIDIATRTHEHLDAVLSVPVDDGPPMDGPPSVLVDTGEHITRLVRVNPDTMTYTGHVDDQTLSTLVECAMTGHKIVVAYDGTVEEFRARAHDRFTAIAGTAKIAEPVVVAHDYGDITGLVTD